MVETQKQRRTQKLKAPVDSGFKVDLGFNVALWVPRMAARAPWGLPTPDLRSTFGQPWVNVGSTFGKRWVNLR